MCKKFDLSIIIQSYFIIILCVFDLGCESDPGMMVLCARDILEWVKNHTNTSYKIKISYLEVYNEEINDLLGDQSPVSKNLKIVSEDAARGCVIGWCFPFCVRCFTYSIVDR